MELVDKNIAIGERLERRLSKSVIEVQNEIYEAVKKVLDKFQLQDGRFSPDQNPTKVLAAINKAIRKIISTSSLKTEFTNFIDDFDQIDKNLQAIHSDFNGIKIPSTILTSAREFQMDYTVNNLRQANISLKFLAPVKQLLFSRVVFGSGILETTQQLRKMITETGGGILARWSGQVARDALSMYQGTINQQIKVHFDFNAVRYVGPLVVDSRPQCVRWTDKDIILDSELASEIKWAYKNGSGMIADTTVLNFILNRGGYNCKHEAIPTRV